MGMRTGIFRGHRVDGKTEEISIGTSRASHNGTHLFRLFELKIPSIEPGLGIELFALEAPIVEPIPEVQEAIWHTPGNNRMAIAELLDRVAGKTGTAEKVVNGRYSSDKRFNAFLSAFPVDDPEYVVVVILDEPKPEKPGMGATSGLNAAPVVSNIIRRTAPLLGVMPEFGHEGAALLVSTQ
jgi:hypothetical protein